MPFPPSPPSSIDELWSRASGLRGKTVDLVAFSMGLPAVPLGLRGKGKAGQLIEKALGAHGGAGKSKDFPDLGVEVKTIPVDLSGRPRESTYVCTLSLDSADQEEWETSWVRDKLSHVLWIPLVVERATGPSPSLTIGAPLLWRPTTEQEEVLRADFDEIVGAVGIGQVESIGGSLGRWLQLRPKAAHSRVRTRAISTADDPWFDANPRGFYLRPSFTGALLRDEKAMPE